jgi:glycosyltransferase involved in cell wall biosynthesis
MRVGLVSTLATRVAPQCSGSIEGLVWLLSRDLTRLGHEVTVFAVAGSQPQGELVATLPGPYGNGGSPGDWQVCEWVNLCRAVGQSGHFDVLHSHAYLFGLPLQPLAKAAMLHTLHTQPHLNEASLRSLAPDAPVTAISHSQWRDYPQFPPVAVIHHGIDRTQFTFRPDPEDYVCYLGRFVPGKGAVAAVQAARELGLRIVLAGPESPYFRDHVRPLVDGKSVEYVGSVTGEGRDRLLGGARTLLYPIGNPEPFGLVMVEAMMCGTPVAAMRLGAVPEIVSEGVSGSCADDITDFPRAVVRCLELDRGCVRAEAELRFTSERMAREYSAVYERLAKGA